jgi:pimeloyl-ACP methyl ester carboxylesterase
MKKVLKFIGLILIVIVVAICAAVAVFWYSNEHWFDKYEKALAQMGAEEKQVTLPAGSVINYGEVKNDKPALLLIHGQGGIWESYAPVMQDLSKDWHIYAVDVYGHGGSSHDEDLYYLNVNGDDIIWFINNVIGEKTVVAGHSNGAITAAYVAAYGGENIAGVVLEDPPIFNTEGDNWESFFAYHDTFKTIHEYDQTDKSECWESYYLRHCYWGELYMPDAMPHIADYVQDYHDKHPGEPVRIGFMPSSVWGFLQYQTEYDLAYGEMFYDLTWNNGYTHEQILSDIKVPCVFIHAHESVAENGIYLCAASREQADRAVSYIENCTFIETDTSDHSIHEVHKEVYINAVNSLLS